VATFDMGFARWAELMLRLLAIPKESKQDRSAVAEATGAPPC